MGQTISVDGPRVMPVSIVEDSRCPIKAVCVWPGQVIVKVRVFGGNGAIDLDLESGKPVQIFDGKLNLIAVTPLPRRAGAIAPKKYRFQFSFAGGL